MSGNATEPYCGDFYPTHGEILIRPGGTHPMRKVTAILKLKPPCYLAYVGIDGN
jgi:hypothetical protein